MPIVEIEGVGKVELEDSFTSMSPEQQYSIIEEISRGRGSSPAPQAAPQEAPKGTPESGFTAAIKNSVTNQLPSSLAGGGAAVAKTLGLDGLAGDLETVKTRNDAESTAEYVRDPSVAPTVREGYKRDGVMGALTAAGTTAAESAGTAVPGLAMGLAKGNPYTAALMAIPNGAIIIDSIREEKKAKGLDPELNAQDYAAAAVQLGIDAIPFAGSFIGKTAAEGVKEVGQEAVTMANAKTQGGSYTADEVLDRSIDSAAAGVVSKGVADVTTGTAKGAISLPLGAVETSRSKAAYNVDPEQARIDLMAMDTLRGHMEATGNFKPGREIIPDEHHFTAVSDDLKAEVKRLKDALVSNGEVDKDTLSVIDKALMTASSTKRDLSAGGLPSAYIETDIDRLKASSIPDDAKSALVDSLSVLNTVSHNRFSNRKSGPAEQFGKKYGAYLAAGAGGTALGPAGIALGMAGPALGGKVGKAVDKLLGLQQLPVVKRAQRVEKYADKIGVRRGDGTQSLKDAIAEAKTRGFTIQASKAEEVANDPYSRVAKEMGLDRAGGWAPSTVQFIRDKTGLTVTQKDLENSVKAMAAAGVIKDSDVKVALEDRNAKIPNGLLRLISDHAYTMAKRASEEKLKADHGPKDAPKGEAPQEPVGSPVKAAGAAEDALKARANTRNPLAYKAAAEGSQARETVSYERVVNGGYSDDVKALAATLVGQTKAVRKVTLDSYLQTLPPKEKAVAKAALGPLVEFGKPEARP